jgi:poly-gamma-glutamate synthesis protein (capsule biosynthesis protein)
LTVSPVAALLAAAIPLVTGCASAMTIAAGGDLYVGGHYAEGAPRLAAVLDGDVRFANLEGPIVAGARERGLDEEGRPTGDPVLLAADPARVALAGQLEVVSLENNHALDQGEAGRRETVERLAHLGIAAASSGAPAIVHARTMRATLLARSYAPGASLDGDALDELARAVRRARRDGPVIVSLHWGHTGSLLPSPEQRAMARALVEAGASAVLGHGPHAPQGVERYHGAIVAYSLGNLAFGCRCTEERDALVVRFALHSDASVGAATLLPIVAGIRESPGRSHDPALRDLLADLSRDLGTTVDYAKDNTLILP